MTTRSIVVFFLFIAGAVQAQTYEVSVSGVRARMGSTSLGSIDESPKDDDTHLRSGWGVGGRFTINTPGYYGHEFGYLWERPTLQTNIRPNGGPQVTLQSKITLQQVFYNFLIYFMPKGERFRPFVTGGAQLQQYGAPPFAEWTEGSSRNYGANYGGGLKIRLFPRALFRIDAREYIGGRPWKLTFANEGSQSGHFRQQEFSAGFGITF